MDTDSQPVLAPEEAMDNIRRRVQHKIAGQFLNAMGTENGNAEDASKKSVLSQNMDDETRKKFEKRFEKYRSKDSAYSIQNVLWLIGSIAVFYYTDFYIACRYDPRVNRIWFNIGAILIFVNLCIACFLIVWMTYIKKMSSDEWETHYPAAIPVATGSFIMGTICVTVGLWPLWSIFTPFILFILFMGMIVTVAMLPNF